MLVVCIRMPYVLRHLHMYIYTKEYIVIRFAKAAIKIIYSYMYCDMAIAFYYHLKFPFQFSIFCKMIGESLDMSMYTGFRLQILKVQLFVIKTIIFCNFFTFVVVIGKLRSWSNRHLQKIQNGKEHLKGK